MKHKKSMEWTILTGAIFAIAILAVLLYIVPSKLSAQGKNVDILGSCKNKQGECKEKCLSSETGFYKSGCPDGTNQLKEYCCIPNDK